MKFHLEETRRTDDKSGREVMRYTPVLTLRPYASGELRFAFWEAWADDTTECVKAAMRANSSARETLKTALNQIQ